MVGLVDSDPYRKASEQIVGLAAAERQPDLSNARVPSSGNFDPQAALPRASQAPAEPEQRGIIEEGYDAFLYSLGPQNIQLFGAGLRSLGATMQQEDMYNAGFEIEKYGEELDFGEAPSMPKIEDAESLARWMAGGLGQGLGSVGAPLASGAVGGLAGAMVGGAPGAVVGAIGAGFAVNDIILAGEAYKQFEDSGVDPLQAAEVAQMIAPAMAALDTLGLVKALKGPGRKASDGILKFMAKRMAHGASVEAATEMAQGVIREITDANLSGDIKATERAMAILEEGVIAGMTGGVLGGAGGIASRRPTDDGPPPTTDAPIEDPDTIAEEEALPEVEEEALPDVEELPETEVVEDLEPEPVPPQTQEDVEAEIDEALAPVEPEPEAAIEDRAEVQEEVDQAPTPEPEPAPEDVPSTSQKDGPTEAEDVTPSSAEVDEDPEYTAALQEGLPIEDYRRTGPAPEVIRGFKDATGERDAGNVLVGQIDDSNWYTNGRLIVKGDLPEGFTEGNGETATPSYVGKNLKPIVDMPSTTERMEVVGAQQITNQDGQAHNMLWLTDNNENFAAVDQESVQFVEREYGEVDWTLAKGDRQGVVKATKDGEVVAVALPFTGDTPTNIIDIAKGPPTPEQQAEPDDVVAVRSKRTEPPVKAWHGSGAVFDKFDVQYMGTGEGAQVFGWGMYAAENKQVGQAYRDQVAGGGREWQLTFPDRTKEMLGQTSSAHEKLMSTVDPEGKLQGEGLRISPETVAGLVGNSLRDYNPETDKISDLVMETLDDDIKRETTHVKNLQYEESTEGLSTDRRYDLRRMETSLKRSHAIKEVLSENLSALDNLEADLVTPGALYELGLNIEPDEMLYWDDKLNNMDPEAQKKIRAALNDPDFVQGPAPSLDKLFNQKTGEVIYRMMVRRLGSDQAASQHLMKHGIKANKYFDGMSRSQRDGTYNYVVFDPDLMEILTRYKRQQPRSPAPDSNPQMSQDQVQGVVERMTRKWNNARLPNITVIKSVDELPQKVKDALAADSGDVQYSEAALYVERADGSAEVYVISDNATSAADVRKSIAHEIVGHFSMREMLGNEFPKILRQLQSTRNNSKIKPFWDLVDKLYPTASEDVKAEEVLAIMAETRVENSIMSRAIAAIRRFLRSLGLRLSYTYNDIRSMIANAEKRLEEGADPRMKIIAEDSDPVSNRTPDAVNMAYSTAVRYRRKPKDEPTAKPAGKDEFKVIDPSKPVDTIFRLLVGGSLTIGPDGNMKYSKAMQDATRKIIMEMRPNSENGFYMPFLDSWLETARHAWLNRYGTPKDFIVRDRQRSAHAYQIMNELVTFLEKIRDAQMTNAQYEALQDVLEGKQLNDAKLNQLAPEIRESIDKYGKQLVELGLLNEETYLENLGTYMHRSYRKYEFDAPDMVKWGRNIRKKSRQALRGDELKMRGMTHKFKENDMIRDVPDKLKEKAKGVKEWKIVDAIGATGRVGKRHYIPVGMENEVPTPQPPEGGELIERGTWKVRQGKGHKPVLWRDYTKEERTRMEEIRDARYNLIKTYELFAHDISTGKFFQDIANNEAWFSKSEPEAGEVITSDQAAKSFTILAEADWVKVPEGTIDKSNAKRWGALAGGYVRAPIWRDINELEKMQNPGAWGWLLREWKANKTARSPTVHFNNFVGNWILSDLYDFRQRDIIRAIKEFRAKGPVYEEAIQHGVFDSGYVRSELLGGAESKKVIDEVLKEVQKAESIEPGGLGKAWMKLTSPVVKGTRAMEQAYQFEDELFRLLSFMNDRAMGLSPEAAAENAISRFMNYDIRAPLPNALRRTIFPFLSYTYAFVPVWLKSVANKPWKIAKIATIGYAISMISNELIDGEEEDERRVMSERDLGYTWAGLPKTLRTPFQSQGDPLYIGLQRVLPGGGLTDADAGHVSGLPEWLLVSGPMLLAAELFLNRMSFNGQEIYSSVDTGMEKSKKIASYLWRGAMPNAPYIPNSYSSDMLIRSMTGETDLFGRNYSPVVAGIRQLGPKLYPFDYDTQLAYRMMDIDRDVRAYKKKLWQAAMDKKNNAISESTYNKTLDQVQEAMARLAEKAQEVTGN